MNLQSKFHPSRRVEKCPKFGGRVWGEGYGGKGGISKKKCKRHKWHSKMKLCRKFYKNPTMGKCSKLGEKVWGEVRGISRKKNANAIQKLIYVGSFIQIGQWETVQN